MIIEPGESNPHDEPCLGCGEETAVGSYFFSDRHDVDRPDGTRGYMCSQCIARIRSAGRNTGQRGISAYGKTYIWWFSGVTSDSLDTDGAGGQVEERLVRIGRT